MPAKKLALLALLPLLSAPALAQNPAPAPLRLGGLEHRPVPGYAGDPADGPCAIVRVAADRGPADRGPEERRGCEEPRPAGRGPFFEWLETPNAISLFPALIAAGAPEPPPLTFGPSGTVNLAAADPAAVVDFLQLDSFRSSREPRPDFRRRATAREADLGVFLPAGTVAAIVRGPRGALLARPARLEAHGFLELTPAAPAAGRADLLLVLPRTRAFRAYDRDHEVSPWLRRGNLEPRRPDQLVQSGDRVLAFFYDLPAGEWQAGAASAAYALAERNVELPAGQATVASFDLVPLPRLTARLAMPPGLRQGPLRIEAFELASGEKLGEIDGIDPRSESVNLGFQPPVEIDLHLYAEPWLFKAQADLRPQQDAEVAFAPRPIAVSGTITRDEQPFQTYITFSPGGTERPDATPTDAGGRYEMVLYRSGLFPVIVETGPEKPAFLREVLVPDAAEAIFDFEVPANEVRVAVLDAESQEPVPLPTVSIEVQGEQRPVKIQFVAGEDGTLELPPLPAGVLTISASAEGYLRSPPQGYDVSHLGRQHELRILLEKGIEPRPLSFRRPDGQPASGIEVRAQYALDDAPPAFEAFTDARGEVQMPAQTDGMFLLWRDPAGRLASGFVLYASEDPRMADPIELSAAAQLVARIVERSGATAAETPLLLFTPTGERLEGQVLQFLHGGAASDAAGFFRARGLPPAPLLLLAYRAGRKHGDLDPLASRISWPWPQLLQLEVAE
jgi:hypothetical protein